MRVLYLIDTLEVGGTERSLLEIARHFRAVEVTVCHVYRGGTLRPAYEAAGIQVVSPDLTGPYKIGAAVRAVRQIVRKRRPDLIHAHLFRAGLVGRIVGKLEGLPVIDSFVSDSYGDSRLADISLQRRAKLAAVQALDALTARWVAHFTANSNAVAQTNARALRVRPSKISVIHRGRDPRPFELDVTSPAILFDADSQPLRSPIFLNVGRLLQSKGQADLLCAFAIVRERAPDANLVIAGEGAFRTELEGLRASLGLQDQVYLLGQRADIPALLAAADVFVFPSHFEGHSGALLEAMFAQKPIVATDIPENRESVEHGKTALLVPSRCPEALAEAMMQMLVETDQANQLASRARVIALERFDIRRIAEQQETLYQSILGATHS